MTILRLLFVLLIVNSLNAQISLTEEEKDWISKNPIIKVGVDENWPPFDFVDEKKNHQGISSEYLSYISSQTNLNFEIYSNKWIDVLNNIKNKNIDMLACADNTINRREYLDFTIPYTIVDIVVVAKKSLKLDSFSDIRDYVIALPEGNFIHEKIKKRFPKAKFKFVESNEEALRTVSYGKADIYVGNLPVITYYMDKYFLTNLEVKFKSEFESAKLSMAVEKDNKILLSILDKVLISLTDKTKENINKKWVFEFRQLTNIKEDSFVLTPEELNWIYNNKEVKIAGDGFWPPYSYYNENGDYVGIIPDLVSLIEEQSGINFKYMNTNTWSETLDLMKDKKIDIIDAISYSKDRSKFLNFSTSYYGTDIVILGNSNSTTYISSINKIINKNKVATVKNYIVSEIIKNDFPGIEKFREYDNAEDGLKALASNQIDYFILDIPSFDYYSKEFSLSNIKILGPTGYHFDYGFGIQKDNKILLSIVNKILHNISKEDIDKIYRKWVKVDFEEKIDYGLIWKIIIGAFFILLGTVYWNRKLQAEIEEKEIVQDKLAKSKDFANAIMNSQLDIIVVTNGLEIKQVNQTFYDVLKFDNLDDFRKNYKCICDLFEVNEDEEFLIPKKDGEMWIDIVLSNPEKSHKAKILVDGKEHIFKVVATKIKNNKSLKTAVFHDITEVENLYKDLVVAKDKALLAAQQKSEFLANMSHEIRTPMNSVIGFAELLDKEISNPIQRDYLSSIQKGGTALLAIINDILDLSKIEAGKMDIKNESINPKNLIMEIESIFHSKIISKNINFIVEVDEDIPDFIIIDSIRLRQILFNLIGNAIKFTEQGSITLKVKNLYKDSIKSKVDLMISIKDTGIGIEKEELNNIFNAFEQQGKQDSKYGGTGLGLSICSKLVSIMNGEIYVESQKGFGSTFTIYLKDIAVSSVGEKISVQKLDFKNIVFEKSTILVVDDIEANRKLVQGSLKNFDFKIIMAENGKVAIDRLKNINVDLILMDLRMPVLDGYKATRIIKDDNKLKDIPLIALTASVMGKDLEKVNEFGFDGYLRKPVILDDLIEKISEFLPYNFVDNDKISIVEDIQNVDIYLLDELIEQLNGDLKEENFKIKNKGDFVLIESFLNKLNKVSSKIKIDLLDNYIEELRNNIDSFDIEKVDFLMNNYEELINKLIKLRVDLKGVKNG